MFKRFPLFLGALLAAFPLVPTAVQAGSGKTFEPLDDSPAPEALILPRDPNGWSFTLEPYLWTMGAAGQVGVKGLPPTQIDYNARTILQHLDWGVMAKGEVRKGRWGLLADGLFAQLSASANPPAQLYSNSHVTLQQGMASLALAYRIIDDRRGFLDVYAGARYNYLGMNVTAEQDSSGIAELSDTAAQRIAQKLGDQAQAYLAKNKDALASQVAAAAKDALTAKALEKVTDPSDGLERRDLIRIAKHLRESSGAYREMVAAVAQARVAAARNQLTSAIQNRVDQAQKKLAKALAREVEDKLPTSSDGAQWWVDPIIGLRAQINFTHWLFLATQGDVGGFGAGSEIAWNVQASLGVNFTRHIFGELGYRYFYMDYNRNGALYDAGEFGAFCGIGVHF